MSRCIQNIKKLLTAFIINFLPLPGIQSGSTFTACKRFSLRSSCCILPFNGFYMACGIFLLHTV
nr:MAG TPA: hypothetical protein [Caudoviricetes sp.]